MDDFSDIIEVLIVEDEDRLRAGLMRALPSMGFAPVEAASAEAAIIQMEQHSCDVLLVDLKLPGMSGMDFFETVRGRWPHAQVIVVTGYGDLDAAKRAVHLDAVEFLTKPVTLAELEKAIGRACQRRHEVGRLRPVIQATLESASCRDSLTDDQPRSLQELERQHILAALTRNHGNRTAAAAELGISRRTLHYRLRDYQRLGMFDK